MYFINIHREKNMNNLIGATLIRQRGVPIYAIAINHVFPVNNKELLVSTAAFNMLSKISLFLVIHRNK